jgi:hypoxanthine phosphoribosyltransferase
MRVVYAPARLRAVVAEMGRKISRDYRGRTLDIIVMMENAFVFAADLIRHIRVPVVCHFVREELRDVEYSGYKRREVFFTSRPQLEGRDVLLVDAVLESGVTQEFLVRRILDSEPRSLRLAVLLDKPHERKVDIHAHYFGFAPASNNLVGYGLSGSQGQGRNLRCIATRAAARASGKRRARRKKK